MSGRDGVAKISGGKTIFLVVKSTRRFQSFAGSRIDEDLSTELLLLLPSPLPTNLMSWGVFGLFAVVGKVLGKCRFEEEED